MPEELADEVRSAHEVYAESLAYADFLNAGRPVTFEVPKAPGTVLSGLQLGNRVLVLRTDFRQNSEAVNLSIGAQPLAVPCPGLQILSLP